MPLHFLEVGQRGDVALFGTAQQISLPMPWYSAILNLGGSVPDRHSIDNLASGLPGCAGCLAAPHDPAVAQMGHQFFLQHAAGLNEQTFINRFVADKPGRPVRDIRQSFQARVNYTLLR